MVYAEGANIRVLARRMDIGYCFLFLLMAGYLAIQANGEIFCRSYINIQTMSDTVIRVENLGKKFIIGHQKQERYTALRDVIANGVKSMVRNTRGLITRTAALDAETREEFWALQDVSFEVRQGDRLGIIGRNGAGKSTLLKVLSRIIEPSKGRVTIHGRVASLLEVGTRS